MYGDEFAAGDALDKMRMKRKADDALTAAELQRNKKGKVKARNLFAVERTLRKYFMRTDNLSAVDR